MVTWQKLVAENLQSVIAMIYMVIAISSSLTSHEIPPGMKLIMNDWGGTWLTGTTPRNVLASVLAVCAMLTYTREQMLMLVVLTGLQIWFCVGMFRLVQTGVAVAAKEGVDPNGNENGQIHGKHYKVSMYLMLLFLFLLLVQSYCVLYTMVRKKVKHLRKMKEEQQELRREAEQREGAAVRRNSHQSHKHGNQHVKHPRH